MSAEERPAEEGEACTCGHPAAVVFVTSRGEVGYCGSRNMTPVVPCPFCGAGTIHDGRCPSYRLRPEPDGLPPGHPANPGKGGAIPGRVYSPEGGAS